MAQRGLEFVGRSQRDLANFPEEVQEIVAFALLEAQEGHKHPDAKALSGFGGAGVLEISESFRTDAYRVVYTTSLTGVIYVLHAFKKKSTRGIATSKRDLDLIRRRLRDAATIHAKRT
jgi:phage-related protein